MPLRRMSPRRMAPRRMAQTEVPETDGSDGGPWDGWPRDGWRRDGWHRCVAQTDVPEMLSPDGWTLRFTAFHFRHIRLCHSSWPSPSRRRMSPRRMTPRRMSPRRRTPRRMSPRRRSPRRRSPRTHLQMVSVSTVLGEKASVVEQSWGASAKLPGRRPPPHWTGRAQVKERIMFCKLRILLFVCFRSTHGWMGMDVWVNVFTMPFLCADSGPWRKMSRAWPPMSAITTSSGSTCPSDDQESAWGAAEARQERVIVEVVRKAIVAGQFVFICWTHLQIFSVSTVLRREDHGRGPVLKSIFQTFWPSPTANSIAGVMFGELIVSLFVKLGVSMGGWEWMCEWMSLHAILVRRLWTVEKDV